MNERDFEMLSEISRVGNITKASEKLCITQSALSKHIRQMESELGVKLLERGRGGAKLTRQGETVVRYGSRITSELMEMKQSLRDPNGRIDGVINAGMSIDHTGSYIADLISEYRDSHMNIQLKICTGKNFLVYDRMINGELDLALLRGDFPWSGYKSLLAVEHVCFISSDNFSDNNTHIAYTTDEYMNTLMNRWILENELIINQSSITADSIPLCVELVKRGYGWCLVPEIYLSNFDGRSQACYFCDGTPLVRNTYLYAYRSALEKLYIKDFVDLVQEFGHRKNNRAIEKV